MKVGGRIIQNKNIQTHNEDYFEATYKRHTIYIHLNKKGIMNDYYVEVSDITGSKSVMGGVTRRCMHDAIVYALNGARL